MNKKTPKWEWVTREIERMRVSSGWLYRHHERDGYGRTTYLSEVSTFVPCRKQKPKDKREVSR